MWSSQSRGPVVPGAPSRQDRPTSNPSPRGTRSGGTRSSARPGRQAAERLASQARQIDVEDDGVRSDVRAGRRSASDLDQSARHEFEEMRGLLKTQPPWSRDIENKRQVTRNYHQTLIFNHPLNPLAQSLDPIWIRTSYPLIVSFRDHVARAESILAASLAGYEGRAKRPPRNSPAEQDLRKVLTRFRQALASEESFYRILVSRLVRYFGLEQLCSDALAGVGLGSTGLPGSTNPRGVDAGLADSHGAATTEFSDEEKKDKVALVYKALICLGDIERYKEQYSDGYRREKIGGVRQKGDEVEERFGKARGYYDVARSLIPDDGSAYNQLAVISTYINDDFSTIYNYFRALAVKVPFKSIGEILDKYLKKAFERWSEQEDNAGGDEVKVDEWKKEVGVLVAVLYRQNGFSNLPSLKATILPGLSTLLLARRLPSETIVRLTVIAIGLHWHARSLASLIPYSAETPTSKSSTRIQQAEDSALDFLLCTFIVLLTISASEVEEIMRMPGWTNPIDSAIAEDDDEDRGSELSSSISAILRRISPSLRIISKWVKLHFEYMSRFSSNPTSPKTPLDTSLPTFWSAYYRLIEALARVFPLGMLPSLELGLEEDEDMRGFLPVSRGLLGRRSGGGGVVESVHPNEEQLMRIADLQVDATLILQAQTGGHNQIPESRVDIPAGVDTRGDDDYASVSTETEDDPVNLAMRASLGEGSVNEYEEEYRQPVPNRQISHLEYTPMAERNRPVPARQTSTTAFDLLQNLVIDHPAPSPTYTSTPSNPPPSAQSHAKRDSLTINRALQSSRPGSLPQSGSGSPGLLFGGEGIWSMTREESNSQKGLKRDSIGGDTGSGRPGSEKPKVRTIGEEGVKALWSQAPGGPAIGSAGLGLGQDRRVSNGQNPLPMPTPMPMDAAQLFAGISGFGASAGGGGLGGYNGSTQRSTTWNEAGGIGSGFGQAQGQAPVQGQGSVWGNPNQGAQGGYGGYPAWS